MRFKRRPPFGGPPLRRPHRRPLLPPRRPPLGGRPQPGQPVDPLLIEANQLFSQGKYLQAAGLYETLAHRVLDRGGPRAPHMFLLAGRANLLGGKSAEGIDHLEYSLRILADAGRWDGLNRIGARVVEELEERGFKDEALRISAFVAELKAGADLAEGPFQPTPGPDPRMSLPTNCSTCGAVIHPQEVEWADNRTAVCSYCGNMVRAEDS